MIREEWTYGADLVFTACHANDWTVAELARFLGVSPAHLSQVIAGNQGMSESMRRKVERAIPKEKR